MSFDVFWFGFFEYCTVPSMIYSFRLRAVEGVG